MDAPHARAATEILQALHASAQGLDRKEARARLSRYGPNALPRAPVPGLLATVLRQFRSPLIYVLLAAAVVSLAAGAWSDAGFILVVLLLNATIGAWQEHGAARAAQALQGLISARALVLRDAETVIADAEQLVPGDIVLLEPGARVPADLRLLAGHNLGIDESLLTGESLPVAKSADVVLDVAQPVAERVNMALAGTMVASGRGSGVVVATGMATELGRIAETVLGQALASPPLLLRMERFARLIAIAVGVATLAVAAVSLARGLPLAEVFTMAVALAVSAIPEGLPVALTIALAVGMRRMARRNVIVRRLVAVEALGSCTCIASDKTGTLTINQLTVRQLQLPDQPVWEVTGEGVDAEGTFVLPSGAQLIEHAAVLDRLCRAVALANEAALAQLDGAWIGRGDTVDVALLVLAHKAGVRRGEALALAPEIARIPYESESRYAASLNRYAGGSRVAVKGAVETVLPMCTRMATVDGEPPLVADDILEQARLLSSAGRRVLAVAEAPLQLGDGEVLSAEHLRGLCFVGLVAMTDPLRPEAVAAIAACRRAGIVVTMVTGDHPATAAAIGSELGLLRRPEEVVTGVQLAELLQTDPAAFDRSVAAARVFARIDPALKLEIVHALQRAGHFVAVTGDGVNDAPALRAAEVGVAMGLGGTDVARETADLVLADDNFASIVAGVEEGRIAYGNIRKVIFLLISTGVAEIALFALALIANLPLPLLAVQLLWLNLVTNGIQDVSLAFEPGEGDEMSQPPRPPRERIFNRLMIERVVLSAAVIGGLGFACYALLLAQGHAVEQARNATLMLMVLFENVQVFNSRSETRSVFTHSPLRNPLLLCGVVAAQGLHVGALYTPGLSTLLGVQPLTLDLWLDLLPFALVLLAVVEVHKWMRRAWALGRARRAG
ncbi:HAD-IC family P-type ATPase [Fontimonas sp. SYSU GA230001]|uniref:cation-translocating P-type ATPase n=1 Tax=Fontimonas sp. SYSU GA230001 TaxID=3142450 RepID=UPI0032B49525